MSADRQMGALDRTFGALLLGLMVIGSLALFIGVPAATLWGLGELVDSPAEHLVLALLAVPSGMALCGIFLAWLNASYLRATGFDPASGRGDGQRMGRLEGPLESILGFCAAIAFLSLLAWIVLAPSGPALGP